MAVPSTATDTPFVSMEPKEGEPPQSNWAAFKKPQLRQFPNPSGLRFGRFLGKGIQGFVLEATTAEGGRVAVKFFFHSHRPDPIANKEVIWPFERECTNNAILEIVISRLRFAKAYQQPIYLHPESKTYLEARANLKAFSDEGIVDVEHPPRPYFQPFCCPDVQINDCLGWAHFDGDYVIKVTKQANHFISATNRTFFCIVYGLVEDRSAEAARIIEHRDFFHQIGFLNEPFGKDNWRGKGVLVDFGDIVPPVGCFGFLERRYRMDRKPTDQWIHELERKGRL